MPGAFRGGTFSVLGPKEFGSWWEDINLNSWGETEVGGLQGSYPEHQKGQALSRLPIASLGMAPVSHICGETESLNEANYLNFPLCDVFKKATYDMPRGVLAQTLAQREGSRIRGC